MTSLLQIRPFFDEATKTVTYLVWDAATLDGAVIDPVLDYDPASGRVSALSVERVLSAAKREGVRIVWTLETHIHADHLSGARLIKAATGAKIGAGKHIVDVQRTFRPVFNADDLEPDGRDFDALFFDGQLLPLGGLEIEVLYTPGHTAADVSFVIEDAVFVGDTVFMPDYGTARTDFPGGDAHRLYSSIRRLLDLPSSTRMFMCHDYKAPGRDSYAWSTTVAEERARNVHIHDGVTEAQFVALRQARDAELAAPALLLPSIQVNIRAGRLPPEQTNGARYLLSPVKAAADTLNAMV